jgi:hypothetical protein
VFEVMVSRKNDRYEAKVGNLPYKLAVIIFAILNNTSALFE